MDELEKAREWVADKLTSGSDGGYMAESREDGRVELIGPVGTEYLVTITVKP
jgi:hypothetical protein